MSIYGLRRCWFICVCVPLLPVVSQSAAGQTPTFALEGVITDAPQAVLPGVIVIVQNNQNLLAGGYINLVGKPRFGQHSGGGAVLPSRRFQFALTYRF